MTTMRLTRLALISVLLPASGGCEGFFQPEPGADPEAVFEHLWSDYSRNFANFEDRGVDWNQLYKELRPRVGASTGENDLFLVLTDLLRPLNDSHVSLTAPQRPVFFANEHDRARTGWDGFNLKLVRSSYLEPDHRASPHGAWVYGKVRGHAVGYFFIGEINGDFSHFHRFLDEYPALDGYIIDLRQNRGGNHTHAFSALGRLTDRTRFVFQSRTRNGPETQDFTPWHPWYLNPARPTMAQPIVVLTDRRTASAAERAVMALRTLPQTIVMGDTTNGSISTKIARELANGWYYSLTPQQVRMFDGASYEGRGLAPDTVIINLPSDVREGVDQLLEAAIRRIP